MSLPLLHTVGVRAFGAGGPGYDAHGNEVPSWGDPVPVAVYAIAPRPSEEPQPGRSEVISGLAVYAPADTVVGPRDRVVIDGEEWEVEGELGDYTRGPWGYPFGVVINVTRVEG